MNTYLNRINHWLKSNQLSLNLDKTLFMAFGANVTVTHDFQIKLNNCCVKRTHSVKYLGVYLDSLLKWDTHVQSISNRTRYLLFIFRKISFYM